MTTNLSLLDIVRRATPPTPWTEGDNIPWDDPIFSARMLREHLSQEHELASRTLPVVEQHVAWLHDAVMRGQPGRILDLGCGPGLYLHRLARLGHSCVGIDFGPASIEHARELADAEGLDAHFVQADLREADFESGFDLVTMIFGQFNVFRRADARQILRRAHDALRPGGRFVMEPQTFETVQGTQPSPASWTAAEKGLFSDCPHLVLHESFWDEERTCSTQRWYILDASSGEVTRHALSCEAYTGEQFSTALSDAGFKDIELLAALPGSPEDGALSAIVATA